MNAELAKIVTEYALPYPIWADEPDSYTLSQDRVPEPLLYETDVLFGGAQGGEYPVYILSVDDYEDALDKQD